jgi:hypothetical protein
MAADGTGPSVPLKVEEQLSVSGEGGENDVLVGANPFETGMKSVSSVRSDSHIAFDSPTFFDPPRNSEMRMADLHRMKLASRNPGESTIPRMADSKTTGDALKTIVKKRNSEESNREEGYRDPLPYNGRLPSRFSLLVRPPELDKNSEASREGVPESPAVDAKPELKPTIDDSSIKESGREFEAAHNPEIRNAYPEVWCGVSDR